MPLELGVVVPETHRLTWVPNTDGMIYVKQSFEISQESG